MRGHGDGGHQDLSARSGYYGWIHHWKAPYSEGVTPMSNVSKDLWNAGVLTTFLTDACGYFRLHCLSGYKLGPLLADMRQFCSICTDLGATTTKSINGTLH